MKRRGFLAAAGALAAAAWDAAAAAPVAPLVLGAAWRGPREGDTQLLGALEVDWEAAEVRIRWATPLPSRAHGLFAEHDGCLLAMAYRPGTWLMRCDPQGRVMQRIDITQESGGRRFDGHVIASADRRFIYVTETDLRRSVGWISVRERDSLRKVAEWRTHGIDPHQLLLDPQGMVVVANGGLHRTDEGRKRDMDRMDSSLVRLDPHTGELRGQWRLDDPRLSLRHIAWSEDGATLGIALQGEHERPEQRRDAPVLALFDGERLSIPTHAADAGGYAGDIAPAPGGGFVLSAQMTNRAVLWRPGQPAALQPVAQVLEPCALTVSQAPRGEGDVLIGAGRGLGRWHPVKPAAMLRWPEPMALDNHWVLLQG